MSVIDLSTADEKNAKLTLKLSARSGFNSHSDYQVSPNQWAEITAICEDGEERRVMRAAPDLLKALEDIVNAESSSYEEALAMGRGSILVDKVRSNG